MKRVTWATMVILTAGIIMGIFMNSNELTANELKVKKMPVVELKTEKKPACYFLTVYKEGYFEQYWAEDCTDKMKEEILTKIKKGGTNKRLNKCDCIALSTGGDYSYFWVGNCTAAAKEQIKKARAAQGITCGCR